MEILLAIIIVGVVLYVKLRSIENKVIGIQSDIYERLEELNRKIDDNCDAISDIESILQDLPDVKLQKQLDAGRNWMDHHDDLKSEGY